VRHAHRHSSTDKSRMRLPFIAIPPFSIFFNNTLL